MDTISLQVDILPNNLPDQVGFPLILGLVIPAVHRSVPVWKRLIFVYPAVPAGRGDHLRDLEEGHR